MGTILQLRLLLILQYDFQFILKGKNDPITTFLLSTPVNFSDEFILFEGSTFLPHLS